jgi:hypothetical protein
MGASPEKEPAALVTAGDRLYIGIEKEINRGI